jgi:Protein of unknown function (DUF1353)
MVPLNYYIGNSSWRITVPTGFVTDFASIPRPLWFTLSNVQDYGRAAIIHDYLYWDQRCTRLQADNILLLGMKESRVGFHTMNRIHTAVRWFGANAWATNAKLRSEGKPRIIPAEYLDIPALAVWTSYREMLYQRGVRPEARTSGGIAPDYCKAGDSTTVPGGS